MSSRGRGGGRKGRGNKGKQSKGKSGTGGSLVPTKKAVDHNHNFSFPCCDLLCALTEDMVTISDDESQEQRPASLLGRMMLTHLLNQRRREVAMWQKHVSSSTDADGTATSSASGPPSGKKKKKKKKKKQSGKGTSEEGAETTSTAASDSAADIKDTNDDTMPKAEKGADETVALSTAASQESNSQPVSPSLSKDEATLKSSREAGCTQTMAVTTHETASATPTTATPPSLSSGIDNATTSANNQQRPPPPTLPSCPPPPPAFATPVDRYLDRLIAEQDKKVAKRTESNGSSASNNRSSSIRDLESFVEFLNQKHASCLKSGNGSFADSRGIILAQDEIYEAIGNIMCPRCREQTSYAVKNIMRQPLTLPAVSFAPSANHRVQRYSESNGFHSESQHRLDIPVYNPRTGVAMPLPPSSTPSMDFDYVALEEGTSPMTTLMEAKADLEGIPYFHPQMAAVPVEINSSPSNGSGNSHKKQNKDPSPSSKEKESSEMQVTSRSLQLQFVSSLHSLPPTATPSLPTKTEAASQTNGNASHEGTANPPTAGPHEKKAAAELPAITVQDLEHIVKNVMLPLALPPDELIGAYSGLTEDELIEVGERYTQIASDTKSNMQDNREEIAKYLNKYQDLVMREKGENVDLKLPTDYLDIDGALDGLLREIVYEVLYDRILLPHKTQENSSMFRTAPSWEAAATRLIDISTAAIRSYMDVIATFERELEELAGPQGNIPEMFVNRAHRESNASMILQKVEILRELFQNIELVCDRYEEVWPLAESSGISNIGGAGYSDSCLHEQSHPSILAVSALSKSYMQHELFQKITEKERKKLSKDGREALISRAEMGDPSKGNNTTAYLAQHMPDWENWVNKLDEKGGSVLCALLDLSKTVRKGRVADIKEEHMVACEKGLGQLMRVGEDVFSFVTEEVLLEGNGSQRKQFVIRDKGLRMQCLSLWTQIQEQKDRQAQEQLLVQPGDEGHLIEKQKKSVVDLTIHSFKLIRSLRKYLTDSNQPREDHPLIPFGLMKYMRPLASFSTFLHSSDEPHFGLCYDSLVAFAAIDQADLCREAGGDRRLLALVLAAFYRKLSEQCSEWHAELAEQELLKTMGNEFDPRVETSNKEQNGNQREHIASRNGPTINNASNTASSGKATKKNKKKKEKKASERLQLKQNEKGKADVVNGDDLIAGDAECQPGSVVAEDVTKDVGDGEASKLQKESNLLELGEAKIADEHGDAIPRVAPVESLALPDRGSGPVPALREGGRNHDSSSATERVPKSAGKELPTTQLGKRIGTVTTQTDKKMGVTDVSGTFQTAEKYLSGRLATLLQPSRGKAKGRAAVVVII